MNKVFTRDMVLTPSYCDMIGRLDMSGLMRICMDTEFMTAIPEWPYPGKYRNTDKVWTIAKTMIVNFERPHFEDKLTINSWIEEPRNGRVTRNFDVFCDGRECAQVKTEQVPFIAGAGLKADPTSFYDEDYEFGPTLIEREFEKIDADDSGYKYIGSYTATSSDINIGHMDNAAYITALASVYSCEERKHMSVKSLELHYRRACKDGDVLEFYEKADPEYHYYRACVNGELVLQVRAKF